MSRLGMLIRVTARAILSIVLGGHLWPARRADDRHLPGELSDLHGSSGLSSFSERLVS